MWDRITNHFVDTVHTHRGQTGTCLGSALHLLTSTGLGAKSTRVSASKVASRSTAQIHGYEWGARQ